MLVVAIECAVAPHRALLPTKIHSFYLFHFLQCLIVHVGEFDARDGPRHVEANGLCHVARDVLIVAGNDLQPHAEPTRLM